MGEIDWVGKWFEILREQGENTDIPFGKFSSPSAVPEWKYLRHEDYDGVGGLAHLLRLEGYHLEKLPELRRREAPGWFRAILAFLRANSQSLVRHMPWTEYDPTRPGKPSHVLWHRFTAGETTCIGAHAAKLGVSTNTLLLWTLDRAILPLFTKTDFDRRWMIPINMRGAVTRPRATANHSSYIGINVPPDAPADRLHAVISSEMKHFGHWGNWYSILIGRWLGVGGMRKVLAKYRTNGHCWIGTFSNIGEWPPVGATPPAKEPLAEWILGVTVTQGHPVGGGCLIWNGRMGISLQFHQSLGRSDLDIQAFLDDWKARLRECMVS
jgi:hypothetical protein